MKTGRWVAASLVAGAFGLVAVAQQDKVQLRFTTWAGGDGLKLLQTLADEYGKQHPDVAVTIEATPFSGYDQKITVQIAGGTPPDAGWVAERSAPAFMAQGFLADLRQTVSNDARLVLSDYSSTSLALWKRGDALYGLPFSFSPVMMYYNKDLFAKAGIPTPAQLLAQNKWTYSAFASSAAAIKKASPDSYGGSLFRTDPALWAGGILAAMYSYGGDVFNKDISACALDSAGSVKAWQLAADMIALGSAPKLGEQVTFASGRLGMFADQVSYSGQLRGVNFKWDVAPMPAGPSGRLTLLGQAGYAVFAASKYPKQAADFVKFLSSVATMKRTAQFFPPPRGSLLNSSTFLNSNPLFQPDSLKLAVVRQVPNSRTLTVPANWPQINDLVVRNLERILRADSDVAGELKNICVGVNSLLKK